MVMLLSLWPCRLSAVIRSSNSKIARYEEHTYLYFEEFDQKLVGLGIPKESDSTGYENISMDQEYVDRFRRILENK